MLFSHECLYLKTLSSNSNQDTKHYVTSAYILLKTLPVVRDPPVARDKRTDPQPRGRRQNKRSLTSNITPTTLYLHHHPYAKTTHIQAVTTHT